MPKKVQKEHPIVETTHEISRRVIELGKDVSGLLAKVKKHYAGLDHQTRRKIAAGIAGLGIVLAATSHHRKKVKQRRNK